MLKILWPMKVTNEEIRKRTRSERLSVQVNTLRYRWIGHVLRMKSDSISRTVLSRATKGKIQRRVIHGRHGGEQLKERDVK